MNVLNTGQVQVKSPFGRWIAKYAADPKFSRYLEIGTWNGQGSTCCFYEGFKNRKDTFALQSYEIAKDRESNYSQSIAHRTIPASCNASCDLASAAPPICTTGV